ncbi:MAG: TetR/AcrR family transcriptional regulator, partial [Microbacteriaceae bacterium]
MPKPVNHHARRQLIAQALWRVVDEQGWSKATMREVAREAGVSLGQLQHYFSSR